MKRKYHNPYKLFRPFRLGERADAWPIEWYLDDYVEDGQGRKWR